MTWFPWKMTRLRQLGAELDATCRGLVDRAEPGRWFGVVLAVWDGNDGNHPTWLACAGRPDGSTRVIGEHPTRRRAARAVYDATTGFPLPDIIRLPVDPFGDVAAAPRTGRLGATRPATALSAARAHAIRTTWAGEGWIGG